MSRRQRTAPKASISPSVVPWLPGANMTATVQVVQSFSQEGESGDLVAFAVFSDGSKRRLPAAELWVRSSTSSLAAGIAADAWGVSVQVGAVRECGDLLVVVMAGVKDATTQSRYTGPPLRLELPVNRVLFSLFLCFLVSLFLYFALILRSSIPSVFVTAIVIVNFTKL